MNETSSPARLIVGAEKDEAESAWLELAETAEAP